MELHFAGRRARFRPVSGITFASVAAVRAATLTEYRRTVGANVSMPVLVLAAARTH